MSENKNVAERHGCIVCAKVYNLLVIYTPQGRFVDCAVTSAGGRRVPDEHRALVACVTHTTAEVEAAYKKWLSRNDKDAEQDE